MKTLKVIIPLLLLLTAAGLMLLYPEYAKSNDALLIINSAGKEGLPPEFRMGLFNTSGSAQFSEWELRNMIAVLPFRKIVILDLREESHGFINGTAVSWYGAEHNWLNIGKSREEIVREERRLLAAIARKSVVWVFKNRRFPIPYMPKEVLSEEELVQELGLGYLRLPITDHHFPTDWIVDQFITFIGNLSPEVWLHFHCSAGKGRTTTLMAMHDMMKSPDRSFAEIIKRQIAVGGIDLLQLPARKDWKVPLIMERIEFLRRFYHYTREVPDFSITWSSWKNENR